MATSRILTLQFWRSGTPWMGGLLPRQALIHYLAIPLFLAFLSGWPQVGRTIAWPKYHALGFWAGLSLSGWWLNDLVTRVLASPLRQIGVPLWLTLLVGVFASSFPSDVIMRLWVHAYYAVFPDLPLDRPMPGFGLDGSKFVSTHIYGYLTWPLITLGLFHLWKMPLFGYVPSVETVREAPEQRERPSFMAKVPVSLQGQVLALTSEQHYLRVHTDKGEALILYRLSDAIQELGGKGLQVHRSHWVASGTVREVVGSASSPRLRLLTGLEVPVSRTFRQAVEKAGFLKREKVLLQAPSGAELLQPA